MTQDSVKNINQSILEILNITILSMTAATNQIKNQVDWQIPNEKEMTTIDDFMEMVKNSEKAPHISFEEFCKVTDEWLAVI